MTTSIAKRKISFLFQYGELMQHTSRFGERKVTTVKTPSLFLQQSGIVLKLNARIWQDVVVVSQGACSTAVKIAFKLMLLLEELF
jgi:hypothetical protein